MGWSTVGGSGRMSEGKFAMVDFGVKFSVVSLDLVGCDWWWWGVLSTNHVIGHIMPQAEMTLISLYKRNPILRILIS